MEVAPLDEIRNHYIKALKRLVQALNMGKSGQR